MFSSLMCFFVLFGSISPLKDFIVSLNDSAKAGLCIKEDFSPFGSLHLDDSDRIQARASMAIIHLYSCADYLDFIDLCLENIDRLYKGNSPDKHKELEMWFKNLHMATYNINRMLDYSKIYLGANTDELAHGCLEEYMVVKPDFDKRFASYKGK